MLNANRSMINIKTNKNDAADAEAICDLVLNPVVVGRQLPVVDV